MALFSRGSQRDALLRKIEGRAWRSSDEKREWLAALTEEGALRPDVYVRLLGLGDRDVAKFAIEGLAGARDNRTLDLLLQTLMRQPQGQWRPLVEAVHALGSSALPDRLQKMLGSKRAPHRLAAVELLGADPAWPQNLDLVKLALRNDEELVRKRVMKLLRRSASHAAVYHLLRDNLRNADDIVRHGAIEALAENPDLEIVEEFFDLLPDEPPRLQELMIGGLARMIRKGGATADRVMEQVLPLLAASDQRIRLAAAKLLAAMPDKIHVLRRFMQYAKGIAFWLRDRSFGAIATMAGDLAEAILELMHDEDIDVVVGAMVMAGQCRDPRVVPGLSDVIRSSRFDWWVQISALETLATFNSREVGVVLMQALEVDELRPAAMACLGQRAEPAAMPRLVEYLQHEKRGMRLTAMAALRHYGDPSLVEGLERVALSDLDEECRLCALELLDDLGAQGVSAAASVRETRRRENAGAAGAVDLSMVNPELND